MKSLFYPLYGEPFRNQFHFSPPFGWMNDINGLWYDDGIYHMTFQYSADALDCYGDNIGVGHAYSNDLIHWYMAPIALSCGRHCMGGVWSGSAYVDKENRAGFGVGAVILANTDTKQGQNLSVSRDGGWMFHAISENPVVTVPDDLKDEIIPRNQRDPMVFWLEEEQCFIMILYLQRYTDPKDTSTPIYGSMDFYASKDMRQWTHFQRLQEKDIISDLERQGKDTAFVRASSKYLRECPCMLQMQCDGEWHWVFWGGDSRYIIGKFEGLHFTVTEAPLEPLSYGPSFYAGQVFANTDRHIAMFWLERWQGTTVDTFPFKNSATVPSELTLVKTDRGLRVYRYPVKELDALHTSETVILANEVYAAPYFDATFTLDWENTTAECVTMRIAQRMYVIKKHSFACEHKQAPEKTGIGFDAPLAEVRVLADRDSIELYFNGGEKSYTEEYGFSEATLDFSLAAEDGKTLSVCGSFYTLKSIWHA